MDKTMDKEDVNDLLNEREASHGNYLQTARMSQLIKCILHENWKWKKINDSQAEALDMIALKIARIVCGNPAEEDHWKDIIGYANLGLDSIPSTYSPKKP